MAIVHFALDALGAPGSLGRTLRSFGRTVREVDAHRTSTLPVDLDETDAIVVCGGGSSTSASSGAIEAFVRAAAKDEIPILGIGAGSRLVARALGGEVGSADERGIVLVRLSPVGREEPLFAGQPWSSMQPVWNEECVARLPEGARGFASTPGAKFAAWGVGPWITCIDWHFEWDAKAITECAKAAGPVSSSTLAEIERLGARLAERVASLV